MKISAQICYLIYLSSSVSAERMVRVLFNKGLETEDDRNCNSLTDSLLLDVLFNSTFRRNLRVASPTNENEMMGEIIPTGDRELYPIYCRDYCRGYAKGTCRATNCKGYRRELEDTYPIANPYNVTCPNTIKLMNTSLNTLVSTKAVSASCRKLLKKGRKILANFDKCMGIWEKSLF